MASTAQGVNVFCCNFPCICSFMDIIPYFLMYLVSIFRFMSAFLCVYSSVSLLLLPVRGIGPHLFTTPQTGNLYCIPAMSDLGTHALACALFNVGHAQSEIVVFWQHI